MTYRKLFLTLVLWSSLVVLICLTVGCKKCDCDCPDCPTATPTPTPNPNLPCGGETPEKTEFGFYFCPKVEFNNYGYETAIDVKDNKLVMGYVFNNRIYYSVNKSNFLEIPNITDAKRLSLAIYKDEIHFAYSKINHKSIGYARLKANNKWEYETFNQDPIQVADRETLDITDNGTVFIASQMNYRIISNTGRRQPDGSYNWQRGVEVDYGEPSEPTCPNLVIDKNNKTHIVYVKKQNCQGNAGQAIKWSVSLSGGTYSNCQCLPGENAGIYIGEADVFVDNNNKIHVVGIDWSDNYFRHVRYITGKFDGNNIVDISAKTIYNSKITYDYPYLMLSGLKTGQLGFVFNSELPNNINLFLKQGNWSGKIILSNNDAAYPAIVGDKDFHIMWVENNKIIYQRLELQ